MEDNILEPLTERLVSTSRYRERRAEIAAFLAAEQATELAQRDQISRIWADNVAVLRSEKKISDWEKTKAAGEMLRVLTQVSPAVLGGTFADRRDDRRTRGRQRRHGARLRHDAVLA